MRAVPLGEAGGPLRETHVREPKPGPRVARPLALTYRFRRGIIQASCGSDFRT